MQLKSIRAKILMIIMPLLITGMVLLSWISYHYAKQTIEDDISQNMKLSLVATTNEFQDKLNITKAMGKSLARIAETNGDNFTKDQYVRLLYNILPTSEMSFGAGIWFEPFKYTADVEYVGPYVYKNNGSLVYTEEYENPNYDFPNEEWYTIARNITTPVAWSEPFYDVATKTTMVTGAFPFYDQNHVFKGIASVDTDMRVLQKVIADIKIGGNGWAFLVDKNGMYLAGKETEKIMRAKIIEDTNASFATAATELLTNKQGNTVFSDGENQYRLYYSQIPETGWILALVMPEIELFAPLKILLWRQIAVTVLFIIIFIFASRFHARRIAKPIQEVVEHMGEMSQGNFSIIHAAKKNQPHDEIDQLVQGFNYMVNIIKNNNDKLESKVEHRTRDLLVANEKLQVMNLELQQTLESLQKTQMQLIQSEKLASLGSLVAGVAHEVNTPLGVGVTAVSYLKQITNEVTKLYETNNLKKQNLVDYIADTNKAVTIISSNLERAVQLTRNFKQIANDHSSETRRNFNVKQYIDEILLSIYSLLKKTKVTVNVQCVDELNWEGYPGAFAQIVTNLIMNSLIHAYEPECEGTITIDLKMDHQQQLCLTYSDDGKGMDETVLSKIFDPFFTTNRGTGSGLGLYILYNIINQQLHGSIKCTSQIGKGTTFLLCWPSD